MKKLIVFPSDSMDSYIQKGQTYQYYEEYFNPGNYFDEVYVLSPWGECEREKRGKVEYIKSKPLGFKKIIKEIEPDVVRAYGGYWSAEWAALSKVKNIPVIVSVHDSNPELIYGAVQYADHVICMTECVKKAVQNKIEYPTNKIDILPNRVDLNRFSYIREKTVENKLNERFGIGKHILHIGRKAEQKNLDTLIRALEYLDESVSVIFVGRGDEQPYKELAYNLNVESRCFFVQSVENTDLPAWYEWCDCFCTPSRWEGFGCVFIEAASCMCPIVTSNIAPMNEYLSEDSAILVDDYNNPLKLAQAIRNVLDGGEKIEAMRIKAREIGVQFSKPVIDQKEIEIYEKVIKQNGSKTKKVPVSVRMQMIMKYMQYR